jgi:hypothetical protein
VKAGEEDGLSVVRGVLFDQFLTGFNILKGSGPCGLGLGFGFGPGHVFGLVLFLVLYL